MESELEDILSPMFEDKLLENEGHEVYDHSWVSLFNFTEKRHIFALAAAVFFALLSGLVIPAMAVIMGKSFGSFAAFGAEEITSDQLVAQVTWQITILAALGMGNWVTGGIFFASWLVFGELQAKVARERLFEGLIGKDLGWYDMRRSGVASLILRVQTYGIYLPPHCFQVSILIFIPGRRC